MAQHGLQWSCLCSAAILQAAGKMARLVVVCSKKRTRINRRRHPTEVLVSQRVTELSRPGCHARDIAGARVVPLLQSNAGSGLQCHRAAMQPPEVRIARTTFL